MNDPRVLARLLRAMAGGTCSRQESYDVIFNAAADILDRDPRLLLSKYETALHLTVQTPYSMVNDAESLRHTVKSIQHIAMEALK